MQETFVQSLGQEDPWRREWLLTSTFLPGKPHRQRSLVGYSPWGCKESDTTERFQTFRLVIAFLPNSKCLLNSWLQSLSTMILELKKRKENLSLLPLCPLLFVIKWWDWIPQSSVQSLSCVWLFATSWTAAHQASLSIINSQSLLKHVSIESVMPSNHLIPCCPLLLQTSVFSSIRAFSNESVLHIRCPKYWSFSFNMSPSIEYSGLIFFRIDWLDLLEVQGTLKWLLQW